MTRPPLSRRVPVPLQVHIDPLATSAWNTLIYGRKRWVLFPPSFSREEVKGRHHVRKSAGEDDEAIDWFNNVLPRIKTEIGKDKVGAVAAHADANSQ